MTHPLAILDLETTGTDILNDRIVEIAVVTLHPDGTRTAKVRRINPERPIPAEATAVHGISDADIATAPRFNQIAASLLQSLEGCDIGGFNVAAFDIPMLYEHFARAGLNWTPDLARVVDAGVVYKVMEPRDLVSAVRFYLGREHVGAHGALADVEATADVIAAQVARYDRFNDFIDPDGDGLRAASRYDEAPPVDIGGKLARNAHGELIYAFGKEKGVRVQDNPDYARWMLRSDFPSHTKALLRAELARWGY
jgi:DNA polymerase-3 subunit epsilon